MKFSSAMKGNEIICFTRKQIEQEITILSEIRKSHNFSFSFTEYRVKKIKQHHQKKKEKAAYKAFMLKAASLEDSGRFKKPGLLGTFFFPSPSSFP
jgi:hypothetical protein